MAIKVWDLEAGEERDILCGHTGPVRALALSGDGKRLVSGSYDRTVKVWDLGSRTEAFSLHADSAIDSVALSKDGRRLCAGTGGTPAAIKVWDLDACMELLTLDGHRWNVSCLALNDAGTRLYSGSFDKSIKVWDLDTGKKMFTLGGHPGKVLSLVVDNDRQRLFAGCMFGC
jgi:WD40 repeat protein